MVCRYFIGRPLSPAAANVKTGMNHKAFDNGRSGGHCKVALGIAARRFQANIRRSFREYIGGRAYATMKSVNIGMMY